MAKALFFNALPDEDSITGYDRNYNADDLSDFLSMVCDTGVVKTNTVNTVPQGLKVVAGSGMEVGVNVGKAVIKGKGFINETAESFTLSVNATNTTRYDYIVVKFDNTINVRNITLEMRTGTSSIPTAQTLTRSSTIYELMLAYIKVAPNTASIAQTDITDTRGNTELCPWFTAIKGYEDYYDAIIQKHESTVTLTSAGNTVITDLPSKLYNEHYSIIEVYTNGIKEPETAFTASVSGGYVVITFTAQKASGSKVTVTLDNFIDGEGMTTVLAQYTQLVQDVSDLKTNAKLTYVCNGTNDNVLISNIVKAFMGLNFYHSMRLHIVGKFGFTAMASGTGTSTAPYNLFDFGTFADVPKPRAIIDFSGCEEIAVNVESGKYTTIFGGTAIEVAGANVYASNTNVGTTIRVFDTSAKRVRADDCRFWITSYQHGQIAWHGTFNNCRGSIANVTENSYCFQPSTTGTIKVYGGEYYAYTGSSANQSAIVGQSGTDAVSILYGVSAPTLARSGFYQTNSLLQWVSGGVMNCTDLISALPMIVVSGISNIRGTIAKSKTNVW